MANWSPSGDKGNSSFFAQGNFRIFLGVSFGFLSCRILTNFRHTFRPKFASLAVAPTLPFSFLNLHPISDHDQLVHLQNVFVSPLSDRLFSSSDREVVLVKTVEYTDQPGDFDGLLEGIRVENVSRVPFALVENRDGGGGFRVIVNNANENHLPLELESFTKKRFFGGKTEKSASIPVSKVTEESIFGAGTRLENVFGRLKLGSSDGGLGLGFPEIELCPSFPDKCLTMSKSEIEDMLISDASPIVMCSLGAGLLSVGLLFSDVRSRFNSSK